MSPSCQKCHFVVSPCHFLPYRFTAKELDEETGLYYYGARYLDPKYSRWLSTDPALGEYIPKAPINEEAKRYNQNLLGMGGVFNHINGNLYHYAGNNPVRYIDPDGRSSLSGLVKTFTGSVQAVIGTAGTLLCTAGAVVLAADDATVIGVLDDPLVIVLAAGAAASAFYAESGVKLASEGIIETADGVSEAAHNLIRNAQTPAAAASPSPLPPDPDDDKEDQKKTKSINQMNQDVKNKKAPKTVKMVHTKNTAVKGEQDHVHFKDDNALNRDGTWKEGKGRPLTNAEKEWLKEGGFKIPE